MGSFIDTVQMFQADLTVKSVKAEAEAEAERTSVSHLVPQADEERVVKPV